MTLSDISIRRPVFAWMIMFALILFGWICFKRMGVSLLPDVDAPTINISITLDGADPESMEVDVVDPVEDAVMSIQGVKNVSSNARTGSASITVEFELSKNIDVAFQEIQTAISRVQKRLPKDIEAPSISKSNPDDNPILWLAVSSDVLTQRDLNKYVREHLKDRFSTVNGVGEVFLGGYVDPNLRVWVSANKLAQYQMTLGDVVATIQSEHTEKPSGRIETAEKEYNIRTIGEAKTVEEFKSLPIIKRGGSPNYQPISIGEIARVEEGLADIRRKSRTGGKPAIGLGIRKQRGSNSVAVADLVKARLSDVRKELPKGVEIGVRSDSTKFIKEAVHELNFTLILSAILTAFVCWLFLGSWSSTFNIVMSIPTSVIGTFIVLYALGFTLNFFTMLGLSLAIGIVVDDAIMVLENIVRHREMGKGRVEAALVGAREITLAAMATTAAIIAIFLPIAFMQGLIGRFLYQFGVTLSVAVFLSLIEALTLTPMRCSQFLDVSPRTSWLGKGVEKAFALSTKFYTRILTQALNHRWKILLSSIVFFVASLGIIKFLKKEFAPAQDQGMLLMRVQTAIGSSLEFTDQKLAEVEKYLMSLPEVDQYYAAIGGFGGGEVNTGMVFLTLKPIEARPKSEKTNKPRSQQIIAEDLRKELPKIKGIKSFVQDLSLSGMSGKRGFPIEFTVRGPSWEKLIEYSETIKKKMEASGLMSDVDSDYKPGLPEYRIVPNRPRARDRLLSIQELDQTISTLFGGVIAGRYSENGRRNDIRVMLEPEDRKSPDTIKKLLVRNTRGELFPISEVSDIELKPSLQAISRQNRERAISVFANVAGNNSHDVAMKFVEETAKGTLPEGYRITIGGTAQTSQESNSGVGFALIMGIIVAYMVLASQFNSFIDPITVLLALPFSITGAFLGLFIASQSINMFSMIGLILLMGIVKKNSILLVEFTNQVREHEGLGVKEALLKACPIRLRAIMMTSIATIAGAIPPALAIGPGAESRVPMAVTIIGGSLVSTILTLLVVPCFYSLVARKPKVPVHEFNSALHAK